MPMKSQLEKNTKLAMRIFKAIAVFASFSSAQAAEIPTDPGDYVPLPEGANLGLMYAQYVTRDTAYIDGESIPGRQRLDTTTGLARLVHYMNIGGYTVDPQIIIPFGKVELKTPLGALQPESETGVGDPLIGATAWFVNNPEQQEWFGLSAFVSLPIGSYDEDKGPVNIGQNRWKGIFQAGYVTGLGDKLMLDIIGEYAIYSENDDYLGFRREQDDTQSIQTHLRYILGQRSHVALSYYHDFGGETTVEGIDQEDKINTSRWLATYATFINPTMQAQIQYGQDISVTNGFREDQRLNLRIAKVF